MRFLWSSKTDEEVLEIAKNAILREGITSRSVFGKKHLVIYNELLKRGLMEDTGLPRRSISGQAYPTMFKNPQDKHCVLCLMITVPRSFGIPCCCGCHSP
jgi:hypothetical protein